MKDRQVLGRVIAAAAGIAAATALHYLTSPTLILWHNLFQRLYYLPIIYAAIYFGWRGGLVASTCSARRLKPLQQYHLNGRFLQAIPRCDS